MTPLYTVMVKTRVDGQIMAIHYREGDTVQQGAPLLEIDARPYEAQLEQYQGQLKRDEALLANAKVDLGRYGAGRRHFAVQGRNRRLSDGYHLSIHVALSPADTN